MATDWLGLSGKRAVVAGAGGIGGTLATALANVGAHVAVLDYSEANLSQLTQPGGNGVGPIMGVQADLSTAEGSRQAMASAVEALGGIDVFVHAVGMNDRRPVLEMPDDVWDTMMSINLNSAFWLGQAAGAIMTKQKSGHVVFLSSVSGLLAHKYHAPYAATKGGVNQLMRVMAREWAIDGVTVNAIAPGYIETNLTRAYLDKPGMRASMEELVPAGRLGSPEDLTGPVLFLLSEQSSFVTGHVMYIDGGRTLV